MKLEISSDELLQMLEKKLGHKISIKELIVQLSSYVKRKKEVSDNGYWTTYKFSPDNGDYPEFKLILE